ncbi:MAG: MurR/RpiR family transcriptional regulator [Ruminococcus sp.]|jgi:DNA-binding MurR/RpiR family transcriptional regulator|nr:MurR/RpiR family transcriptional regulator [Ruminococcus sp.]
MSNNLIEHISEKIPEMSKGHKKISNYIIENTDKAAFMTAAKLGEITGVSESTVVRYAMILGFDGYPELLTALREYIGSKLTSVQRMNVMNDRIGSSDVLEKIINMDIEKLRKTLETLSRDDFSAVVDNLCASKTIYVIGARSAAVLARYAAFYFNMMFENVKLIHTTSTSEMFEQILNIGSDDLMIGMSFPRYSRLTVNALRYAKDNGAKVVALTDSKSSPLCEYADNLLIAKNTLTTFADSLIAPMSVLNALIAAVGMRKQDYVSDNFNRMEKIYEKYQVFESK